MSASTSSSPSIGPDGAVRYKKRKANFTFSEVHILLDEVRKNRHIVVGKFNSGIPSDIKRRKWTEITQRINEIGECDREVGEVIKKWSDLKCDTKRKIVAIHSGSALPHSPDLSQTENIVSSILDLDKRPWEATRTSRGRSRSEDQDTVAGDEDDDVALMGLGLVQDSPRSGIETKPMLPPFPGAAVGGLDADTDSHVMDSDDDHHDVLPSSVNNSEEEGTFNSVTHVSSSSAGHAQPGTESDSAREQLAQSASMSVQEQHVTNALLCTVSRSLELLAESVQQLAETQQEFARESLRLQRETVQVLREFASGALTLLHERVNGKPPLV